MSHPQHNVIRHGCPYGTHRVLQPTGVLPQPAWQIDNHMAMCDNEILIDVSALNVDAASFTQIKQAAHGDVDRCVVAARIVAIVLAGLPIDTIIQRGVRAEKKVERRAPGAQQAHALGR